MNKFFRTWLYFQWPSSWARTATISSWLHPWREREKGGGKKIHIRLQGKKGREVQVKDTAHKRAAWSARSLQGEGAQHMYKGYRQAQAN